MNRKQIAREIDFVDNVMQSHFKDYGEETHRALQEAIELIEQEPVVAENTTSVVIHGDLKELKQVIDNNPLNGVMPIETKEEILNNISKELTRLAINYFNISPEFNDYLKALNDVQDYIDKIKGE